MKKLEIERRFLVKQIDRKFLRPYFSTSSHIRQGYFEVPNPDESFRVRITDRKKSSITIKTKKNLNGLIRDEDEHKTNLALGKSLMAICHHYLKKQRLEIGGWEINFYLEPLLGIITAEKELDSLYEKVELPPWIPEAVEVTGNLTDLHLARLASELRGTGTLADLRYLEMPDTKVLRIALLGAPGSGKDGIAKRLARGMADVRFVPETASIVMAELGIRPSKDRVLNRRFQQTIYRMQRIFESSSVQAAKLEDKNTIVTNRGTLDNAEYFEGGLQELTSFFRTTVEIEYSRYDAVIFLDKPSKEIFEKERLNNPMRYEKSYEEICARHERFMKLWQNHPNFYFVRSEEDWDRKVEAVREILRKIIGEGKESRHAAKLAPTHCHNS